MTSMTGSVVAIRWLCFMSQVQTVIYTLMLLLVLSNQKEKKKDNELKFKFFDFLAGVMYRIQRCTGQSGVSLLGLKPSISNPACSGSAWDCKGWDSLLRWLHSDHLSLVFLFLRLSDTACQDMLLPGKPLSL